MKHVALTIDGREALLGHVEKFQTMVLRANGRVANDDDILPSFANIDDLPEAPANTGMMADTRLLPSSLRTSYACGGLQRDMIFIGVMFV